MREVLLLQTPTVIIVIGTILIFPIYYIQHPFFEQFKIIQNKKWPWLDDDKQKRNQFWKLTNKSLKLSIFNLLFLIPSLTYIKSLIMTTQDGSGGPSFDDEDWPDLTELVTQNLLLTIIHEFLFHTTHKMCHMYPSLYKYHKVHHEYKDNVIHASQHNHPIDHIFSIATPALISMAIVQPHSFTQFHWTVYVMVANLDDHIGYAFPFSPVRWFPFAASTQEHEFHHGVNIGCYSSKLNIFEKIFKTNEKFISWEKKRMMMMMTKAD
jgi:sterol desaturase/sphingolipid hydroxylase (fatty acid hydroxylase superfamily)